MKTKEFHLGSLVLMYDIKFFKHPGKFQMHWMGLYKIEYVTDEREMKMSMLNGEKMEGLVNVIQLKPYRDNQSL